MAKKRTKNKAKTNKKRTEHPWPRITLQSPTADVVKAIEPIVKNYKMMGLKDVAVAVKSISYGQNINIHTYFFGMTTPKIDRICDWLRHNRKDLYNPVWNRWQDLKKTIEETDKFVLDNVETKGIGSLFPDTDIHVKLKELFGDIKFFKNILEDTATNLATETTQQNKPAEDGAKMTGNINIHNSQVIIGDVQAENIQSGDHSSIHKETKAENKNRLSILKILGWLLAQVKWLFENFWPK